MGLFFSRFGVACYALLCAIVLAWWLPHFFAANLALVPQADYRYLAASGLPFGLFLLTAVARQALWPSLRWFVLLQVFLASITLYACKLSFYYAPQATFFCPLHVWFCGAFLLMNLYQYRRELKALKPRQTAEA